MPKNLFHAQLENGKVCENHYCLYFYAIFELIINIKQKKMFKFY